MAIKTVESFGRTFYTCTICGDYKEGYMPDHVCDPEILKLIADAAFGPSHGPGEKKDPVYRYKREDIYMLVNQMHGKAVPFIDKADAASVTASSVIGVGILFCELWLKLDDMEKASSNT